MSKEEFLKQKEDVVGKLMQYKKHQYNIYIEGPDDYDFYSNFFKNSNIVVCHNRQAVLKANKMFNNIINTNDSIFFIDRDYKYVPVESRLIATDYYNIESHIYNIDNFIDYLKNKHHASLQISEKIQNYFSNKELINILHFSYEKFLDYEKQKDINVLTPKIKFLEDGSIDVSDVYPTRRPNFSQYCERKDIKYYNGKELGLLILKLCTTEWFRKNMSPDGSNPVPNNQKVLRLQLIINLEDPSYIKEGKKLLLA